MLYNSKDSLTQPDVQLKQDTSGLFSSITGMDLSGIVYKNVRRFFNYVPARIKLKRAEFRIIYAENTTVIGFKDFKLKNGKVSAILNIQGNEALMQIPVNGRLDKAASIIELKLAKTDSSLLPLPLLQDKYGISSGFDSLSFRLDLAHRNRRMVNIQGTFSFTGLRLNGERLSTENVKINQFRSSFKVNIGNDYLEVDSSSVAYLNRIRFNQYIKISAAHDPIVVIKILPQTWNAADFFSSLPQGMFTSLTGIKTVGTMHYYMNFSMNPENPDSLLFNTRLTAEDFKIVKYGTDDYRIINGSFLHRVYEHGRPVAAFIVGPENPDFTPFEEISPFLRAAVMTSEDGSFFFHNGFNEKAFRESMVTNIKERRFARGGSTISMQLVKNVFLTRNKTLARKIEEALIVWLIESKNLVSKQRMYEVYLNIIEWGPGIYGIKPASRFYFNKLPSQLNLQESVYLASIVPHPKWYKYTFETNGVPRSFYGYYFNRMKDLMVRKQFILPSDTNGIKPDVLLTGTAAQVFATADTVAVDSVKLNDLDLIPAF